MANPVGFLELERVKSPKIRKSESAIIKNSLNLSEKEAGLQRADAWIVGLFVIMGAQLTMSFQTSTA